jgi:hypothetical protein
LALGHRTDRLNPGQKAFPELLAIQLSEDPTEGIVGRDAVGQFQKLL